jgi:serine/threonine protein kinase
MRSTIALSRLERYEVIDRKEGGMGRIYILKRLNEQPLPSSHGSRRMQDEFRFVYRDFLAAKSIKSNELESQFLRELNIWITLKPPGIAPLLKIIRADGALLGVMPAYECNLREYMKANIGKHSTCLPYLRRCVHGLHEVSESGVLHLDLKPENLLVTALNGKLQIDVSDWGISNVKMELARVPNHPQGDIATIVGAGTVPYMSPERFGRVKPDIRADVFSLGMVFYEVILGEMPYSRHEPCEAQIMSGRYMDRVRLMEREGKLPRIVVDMLQPDLARRPSSYTDVLRFLSSCRE